MVKRILPCIASILVAGSAFSQDLFSFYSSGFDTNSSRSDISVREEVPYDIRVSFWKKPLEEQSFPNHFISLLEKKFQNRKVSIFEDSNNEEGFRHEGEMSDALFQTCVERYEIAKRMKQLTLWAKEKVTVETELKQADSRGSSLKLVVRPSVKGFDYSNWGMEVALKNSDKVILSSLICHPTGAELRVPIKTRWKKELDVSLVESQSRTLFSTEYSSGEGRAVIKYEKSFW